MRLQTTTKPATESATGTIALEAKFLISSPPLLPFRFQYRDIFKHSCGPAPGIWDGLGVSLTRPGASFFPALSSTNTKSGAGRG